MLLNRIQYTPPKSKTAYPFNLPWQASFRDLTLSQPVTILTGDNGSGKSTLLNAIAANYNAILMSGASLDEDPGVNAGGRENLCDRHRCHVCPV